MRKIILLATFILSFILSPIFSEKDAYAQTEAVSKDRVDVVVFVRKDCTHCRDEEKFIGELQEKRQDFQVTRYSLDIPEERKVWEKFTDRAGTGKVTPITVVGDKYIIGFDTPDTTGQEIITLIDSTKKQNLETDLSGTINPYSTNASCDENGLVPCSANTSQFVNLPFLGRIDTQKYPLFVLSALFGFFDGFNPCAMWVLVTFLLILLQVGNRKKMFLFAGTFILAEAVMYSLILVVWYKTWDFVRLDSIVTPLVGAVSVIGGFFFIREWRKKELECKVTNLQQRKKISDKVKNIALNRFTLLSFISVLGIAFSVNVIEFACSIGIPQTFTKILELNRLSLIETVTYITTYILFYMIDDFIVFGIALYGMDKLSLTTKYSKMSNLVGGIVMVILGFVMIFRPSLILF